MVELSIMITKINNLSQTKGQIIGKIQQNYLTPHSPQSADSLHKKSVEGVWGLSKNVRNIALVCWLSVSKGATANNAV